MKDLRRAYNMAWQEAESMKGDFQDCLLHCLSKNLGMPILNDVSKRPPTDEGIEEMCRGVGPSDVSQYCEKSPPPARGKE